MSGEPTAALARDEIRSIAGDRGHPVDRAQRLIDRMQALFEAGTLQRSPAVDAMIADLATAIAATPDGRPGGKSPEAARLIMAAIVRQLDRG